MNKEQWNLLNEIIESYSTIHNEIGVAIGKELFEDASTLLLACQENAIELGKTVEESEGVNCTFVKHLEEYCEEVFSVFDKINSANMADWGEALNNLLYTFDRVCNSFTKDIIIRKEVVFLPYKASMWDSLESIWKKYDADANWEAKVVPIPYFDRKSDGSLGEAHYEGDSFPQYVPIVDYNKYNFEKRHPEEIYICNPYDANNYVTCIHPFFFSKNIHNYTDKLIYVPYFVLAEPNVADPLCLKGMEHFVLVSGVLEADKVIVQSENMRRAYIEILTSKFGSNTKSLWEEKIKGEGSPKFDKLQNTKKEELEIPREWQSLIKKVDGSNKKVVLYNTSISELLEQKEKMITKISKVISIFYENRDEVVLWWRPHPLIEATLTSMHPELWADYKSIRDEYVKAGWGIYDNTPELDRALVYSDAYYGGWSSLVELYRKTGKLILIQDANI